MLQMSSARDVSGGKLRLVQLLHDLVDSGGSWAGYSSFGQLAECGCCEVVGFERFRRNGALQRLVVQLGFGPSVGLVFKREFGRTMGLGFVVLLHVALASILGGFLEWVFLGASFVGLDAACVTLAGVAVGDLRIFGPREESDVPSVVSLSGSGGMFAGFLCGGVAWLGIDGFDLRSSQRGSNGGGEAAYR